MNTQYDLELTQARGLPYRLFRFSDPLRRSRSHVACIPVLFLHGNQGSYKQARTIGYWLENNPASMSKRQCYTTYTVDFLEQWSVVSERVIQNQSQFVKEVVSHIKAAHSTNKLIIVGHSMGSVVARLAFKEGVHSNVTLVSLAAPLDKSPLSLDGRLGVDYSFPGIQNIIICGGSLDVQIVPFPTSVDGRHQNTETIPMVWASPDHQAIVWAHQVIEYLGRLIHSIY